MSTLLQHNLSTATGEASQIAVMARRITESERTNELERVSRRKLHKVTDSVQSHTRIELNNIKRDFDAGYQRFTEKTENIYGVKTVRSHLAPTNVFRKRTEQDIKLHKDKSLKDDTFVWVDGLDG